MTKTAAIVALAILPASYLEAANGSEPPEAQDYAENPASWEPQRERNGEEARPEKISILGTLATFPGTADNDSRTHVLVYRDPDNGSILGGAWEQPEPDPHDAAGRPQGDPARLNELTRARRIPLSAEVLKRLLPRASDGGREGVSSGLMRAILDGDQSAIRGLSDPDGYRREQEETLAAVGKAVTGAEQKGISSDFVLHIARHIANLDHSQEQRAILDEVHIGGGKCVLIDTTPY